MSPEQPSVSSDNPRLDAAVAEYLQAADAGRAPDRTAFLARHPDLAEELASFFADLDRLERAAPPRSGPADSLHTLPPGQPPAAASPTVRYFGDYELLGEIGRGNMGVVYRARQMSLNRMVALKMILAGQLATEAEVIRFRAEAEAAAQLDHPNIVPIYEVGEHEGLQYFSMKLIEGNSLGDRIAHGAAKDEPTSLPDAARLLATVARAVHHAHQRGVLHRDLKPGNILLDADGRPYVTDFGLAKRTAGVNVGLTQTGMLMGTPRYMAPEQTSSAKGVTTASDVYALGVILYEMLTGRPPFVSGDFLELVYHIQTQEPASPRTLNAKVDRDLETVCLKCLQKQPGERYESAAALADDLERWLRGEPIEARPAGKLGRAWRWCRRNPAVAGLLAAVLLVFATGATVSTILALLADRRAGEAVEAQGKAERKEVEAVTAQNELQKANAELETSLALSLFRPLGLRTPEGKKARIALTNPEIEVLWELAGIGNPKVLDRFVEVASRSPMTSRQLRNGAAHALHAAVGLNPEKRQWVERLLQKRLQETLDLEQKADLAVAAVALGDLTPETAAVVAEILVAALIKVGNTADASWLTEALAAVSPWLDQADVGKVADALIAALSKADLSFIFDATGVGPSCAHLVEGLKAMSPRLDAARAGKAADALVVKLNKAAGGLFGFVWCRPLAKGLAAVSTRLEVAGADRTAAVLTAAMEKTQYDFFGSSDVLYQAEALVAVLARLDAARAAAHAWKAADVLVAFAGKASAKEDSRFYVSLAEVLVGVSAYLDATGAAAPTAKAAEALVTAMGKKWDKFNRESDNVDRERLVRALQAVMARLDPRQAAAYAAKLDFCPFRSCYAAAH
jgi:hypothetical protein